MRFCSLMCVKNSSIVEANDFAVVCTSAAWQPGRGPSVIHMILFGIDRAVIHPLPVSSLCPPPVLLSSVPGQGWIIRKTAWAKTSFVFRHKQKIPVSRPAPVVSFLCVFSPITTALSLYSLLSVLFSPPSYPLASSCLLLSKCLSFSSSVHHQFQFTSVP